MTRKTFITIAATIAGGGLLAFFGLRAKAGDARLTIQKDDLKKRLADGSIHLIDVREREEFAVAHIAGARNMPLSAFDPKALPQDGKTVVLMCRSGNRSGKAQAVAAQQNISTLNYTGSMLEWQATGEPVVSGP